MLKHFSFDLLKKTDLDKTLELRNQDQTRSASFNKNLITINEHYATIFPLNIRKGIILRI